MNFDNRIYKTWLLRHVPEEYGDEKSVHPSRCHSASEFTIAYITWSDGKRFPTSEIQISRQRRLDVDGAQFHHTLKVRTVTEPDVDPYSIHYDQTTDIGSITFDALFALASLRYVSFYRYQTSWWPSFGSIWLEVYKYPFKNICILRGVFTDKLSAENAKPPGTLTREDDCKDVSDNPAYYIQNLAINQPPLIDGKFLWPHLYPEETVADPPKESVHA